jgi:hypothetical protein
MHDMFKDMLIEGVRKGLRERGEAVSDGIEQTGDYQKNYMDCLFYAYHNRHEIVLTPDIVWYTLLCELAGVIAENPDAYKQWFTNMPEGEGRGKDKNKKLILIEEVDNPNDLTTYLGRIIAELKHLVPSGLADSFLIDNFSTAEWHSTLAQHAAFADAVHHYYEYAGMQGYQSGGERPEPEVGIPFVHLKGCRHDWEFIRDHWKAIAESGVFPVLSVYHHDVPMVSRGDGYFSASMDYFHRVHMILSALCETSGHQSWLRKIYLEDEHGTAQGWFKDLFVSAFPILKCPASGYPTHVSEVPYYNFKTKEDFALAVGLFSKRRVMSEISTHYTLTPSFGHIVFKVTGKNEKQG